MLPIGLLSLTALKSRCSKINVADPDAVVERLLPFDAICVMRERTPLPRAVLERLPRLKLIASTGPRKLLDRRGCGERARHRVTATGYRSTPTIEMTWALILASARQIVRDSNPSGTAPGRRRLAANLKAGCWACWVSVMSADRSRASASPFGMKVIAWSQNMTSAVAEAAGATLVTRTSCSASRTF